MSNLTFLGSMGEVGASGILVDTGEGKFLLDYGASTDSTPSRPPMQFNTKIDSVLLSHAHFDHCGSMPLAMKQCKAPIYAAPCTQPLTEMLLYDSVKIHTQEMGNMEGGLQAMPYTNDDVKATMRQFKTIHYRKPFRVNKTMINYFDAGHIPGSAMIHLKTGAGQNDILYTGDYQAVDSRLLKKNDDDVPKAEVMITESTYGDKDHPDRAGQEKELIDIVTTTVESGGIAMIPSFAVGRAAELLLVLEQKGIDYPVYMDGMAKKATSIVNRHSDLLRNEEELDETLKKVQFVTTSRHRARIIREPCAIITTSGMMDGGPIGWYMSHLYDKENCSVTFTGWQAPDSVGKALLDTGKFTGNDMDVPTKVSVKRLDFSAHVGRTPMLKFIKKQNPEKIFCVHGDDTKKFADELRGMGFDANAPMEDNNKFKV